jgi:large subunit ribosomal protein L35
MPKMKIHSGAKKRFKVTGTGKLRRERAFRKHKFEGKASTRTRRLKGTVGLAHGDGARMKRLLGK